MTPDTLTGLALTIAAVAALIGFLTWAERRGATSATTEQGQPS